MSPGSSCSFTSGTPSTDLRFSEYHLEKVSSYLTPSEEDELSLTDRPSRTYSFGSQSETTKNKGKVDMLSSADGRVRAFSVGSKWGRPRNLTKEAHKLPLRSYVLPQSSKSSSAPLLSSSWSGTSRQANDPMADLMEIDFTENRKKKKNTTSKFRVLPVMEYTSQLGADIKSSLLPVTSSADSGYMDMSSKSPSGIFPNSKTQNGSESYTVSPPSVISSSPRTQGFNAIFGKSPPKAFLSGRSPPKLNSHFGRSPPKSSPLAGGVENSLSKPFFSPTEMPRTEPKNTRLTKPAIISSSTLKTIGEKPDVKPQKFPTTSSANLNMYALFNQANSSGNPSKPSGDYMEMRVGNLDNQQGKEDQNYMEMGGRNSKKFLRANSERDMFFGKENQNKSLTEGYVEMSCGGKLIRKLSGDGLMTSHSFDDYMPMSGGSKPIAIKGSFMSNSTATGRSTPPKVPTGFMGLGSSSSFDSSHRGSRRKNRKKHDRRGSKENLTTMGSNSTIFPMSLSSPTSPKKIGSSLMESNETLTPTNSPSESTETSPAEESLHVGLSPNDEDSLYEEMTPGIELEERNFLETCVNPVQGNTTVSALSDSLSQRLQISSKDGTNDYVNYSPQDVTTACEQFEDYACMKPTGIIGDKTSSIFGFTNMETSTFGGKSQESGTEVPSDASTGVPFSATATLSDSKSDLVQNVKCPGKEEDLHALRLASSQLSYKTVAKNKAYGPKDIETPLCEDKVDGLLPNLNLLNFDNSKVSVGVSWEEQGAGDKKSGLNLGENHPSVTRQVSSSSSSSTEVASIKETSSPGAPISGASRPSSTGSEKDITYASLDLGPSGSEGEEGRSPRNLRGMSSVNDSSASSHSPNPAVPSETFNYVKIDFEKSGSLRAPDPFAKKIHY